MNFKKLNQIALYSLFLGAVAAGCDTTDSNSQLGEGDVQLQFKTVSSSFNKAVSPEDGTLSEHDALIVEGSNGSLHIDDIRFIVEEFELEADDDDGTELEEFEAGPFWVDLPLDEDTLRLGDSRIQAGLYEELEFEIEDLDFNDDEDGDDDEEHRALADSIRSVFPDWPDEASMIITGSFTPTGGDEQPFRVYIDAEIEIEREFNPPLEVTENNVTQVVSIRINPSQWLTKDDGTVFDLSVYDWDKNQQLLEFEAELEDGIEDLEIDDDEDTNDDNDD